VDKVMDGEDERARTPDRRIKARAKIYQRAEGAQYAGKEHRLKRMQQGPECRERAQSR
jgi:ribosomal protein S24E